MKKVGLVLVTVVLLAPAATSQVQSELRNLDIVLMQWTFPLQGRTAAGSTTLGTAFILLRPQSTQPAAEKTTGRGVLVTAAHLLRDMAGDYAVISLRSERGDGGTNAVIPARLRIRDAGRQLWTEHPTADVAVMYVGLPFFPNWPVVSTDFLIDDERIKKYELGPGVELKCLGYPLGQASNASGFPILRTGFIASYPLLPTEVTKTFLFDFRVFKGNSGGPVYFSESLVKGGTVLCCKPQFLMGLVSEERILPVSIQDIYETTTKNYQLSIGVVVHASLIKDAIDLLPLPGTPEAASKTVRIEPIGSGLQQR